MDGGKFKGNYLRLMPGLCLEENELVGKFKMAAGDIVSILTSYFGTFLSTWSSMEICYSDFQSMGYDGKF